MSSIARWEQRVARVVSG